MDRFSVLLGVAQTASQQHDPAELEDALSATRHIRHRRHSQNSGGCKPVRHASRHHHMKSLHLTPSATSAAPPQACAWTQCTCLRRFWFASAQPAPQPSPAFQQPARIRSCDEPASQSGHLPGTSADCMHLWRAPEGSKTARFSPAGQPPGLGDASMPGSTPCATLPAPGMRTGRPAQQREFRGPEGEHTATNSSAATFTSALVPSINDVCSSILQITFCVAVKEARIARNARRILQYLLDNLTRGQASTVESVIRRDFGNTPNTSKSLRLLVSSRTVARAGQGGRVDAFRYSIPSDVLAVIAPGASGAHRGAAAASPPTAGAAGAAGLSGAVRDPDTSAVATPGAQTARCVDLAAPNAPAKRSPAQPSGPCSPVFSKTRARAAFAAAALQAPEAAAAMAMHPMGQAAGMQSPSRAVKRKAHMHGRSEHPRKRAAAGVLADADQSWRENSAPSPGPLQMPGGAGAQPQEAVFGGQPQAPPVNIGLLQAAASPKLSAAESIGSDSGQPASSDGGGPRLPGKLRLKAGEASGPWRGQGPNMAAGQVPPATGARAGGSGGMADSSPLPARAPGSKENLAVGLEISLKCGASEAAVQGGSPVCVPFRPSQHASSSWCPATLPAPSSLGCVHQPATSAKEPALLEAVGRMAPARAPLPAPLSAFGGHSATSMPHACPPLFCTPPVFCSPVRTFPKDLSMGAAVNAAGDGDGAAPGASAKPISYEAAVVRMPLADVTLVASNAPPDTAQGSQGMESAATAAPAGAWGI